MTVYPAELLAVRALAVRPGVDAVVAGLWEGAQVAAVTPIMGGLGSAVDRVDVLLPDGAERQLVLRRQVPEWHGDVAVEHDVLDALVAAGVPVPAARWSDPSGQVLGVGAILIDHVPGELVSVALDVERVRRMGAAVAAVHQVPSTGWPASLPREEGTLEERLRVRRRRREAWARAHEPFVDPESLWDAIEAAVGAIDPGPPVLVHDDYHPGNVIDDGERATIIDWGYPVLGHAGFDLGYAMLDLALTGRSELHEPLLDGYRTAVGDLPDDLWFWQLVAVERSLPSPAGWLPAYHDQGHPHLTVASLEDAGRRFLAAALAGTRPDDAVAAGALDTLEVRDATLERDA